MKHLMIFAMHRQEDVEVDEDDLALLNILRCTTYSANEHRSPLPLLSGATHHVPMIVGPWEVRGLLGILYLPADV
jgi:hypothetical protein